MSDGSTAASLEAFVGILQKAFANPEICLRVLQRSLDLSQVVSRAGELKAGEETFRAQMQNIAAIFDDLCREGTTRVRVTAAGVFVRRHFCVTESDFRLLRDVKNFAVARAGFTHIFGSIKSEEGGSFESANATFSEFCADARVDALFAAAPLCRYLFHVVKCDVFRRAPKDFFYAAHMIGTFLQKKNARSTDTWFALLHASTFYSEVHVSLEEWAPDMRHLRVWRELPKRCAPYNSQLQRLARRLLTFSGQRKMLVDLLEGGDDASASASALVAAFEGGAPPHGDKAFAYAAWFLDDAPFPMIRETVAAEAGWTRGFDLLPFVCPNFFAGSGKRRRRDALSTRVAYFWATWRALRGFPEIFEVPFAMWLGLFEESSREPGEAGGRENAACENILRGRPHLTAAVSRVRAAAEARAWTEAPPGVPRVAEGLRGFFRQRARFETRHVYLRTMGKFDKTRAGEATGDATGDTKAWLRERKSDLLTIDFPTEGEVSWMDVHTTIHDVWQKLSASTSDCVRAVRALHRSLVFIDADFAVSMAHASSLQSSNATALDHLFLDGRFDGLLDATMADSVPGAAPGCLERARGSGDPLGALADELSTPPVKKFSDFFSMAEKRTRYEEFV